MSTIVLGINPGINSTPGSGKLGRHDPSACLVKDGNIIAAVEEERFTRNKWGQQRTNSLPENSIQFVLNNTNISSVDAVAIGWDPSNFFNKLMNNTSADSVLPNSFNELIRFDAHIQNSIDFMKDFAAEYTDIRERQIRNMLSRNLDEILGSEFDGNIVFVPHHRSHAASAYFCSGFDQQLVITADGGGEHHCTVLWSDDLEIVNEFTRPNSIGHFYSTGAEYLGYTKPSGSRHAGKVMGLAPYGEYRERFAELFDQLVEVDGGGYDVTGFRTKSPEELERYFGERHEFPDVFEQHHKDFAFHLQKKTEEIMTHLVQSFVSKTGINNVSVAGGVFLNCKMNRKIAKLASVNNLFIQPVSNDAGVALGSALEVYNSITGREPVGNFDNVYFGTEYDNSDVERILEEAKISYKKIDYPCKKAAELLSQNRLIGWFQGQMEFGPRALGNRSILANPRSVQTRDLVNKNVKNREKWRPFAPSLLYESKDEYLQDGFESPYMIMTDGIREEKHEEVPGIVHVDGTARPQTVRREENERYYKLLKEFKKITGIPVLLNTSFNVSGEPIVESPKQAIADFYSTGLDALFIEDYLVRKN